MKISKDVLNEVIANVKKTLLSTNLISVGIFSLILIILSFMIHFRSLGFFLDDLPELHALVVRGFDGIKTNFLFDDRPFGWWPHFLLFKVLGTNPLGWHLANNLLRWIVGLELWLVFSLMWGKNRKEIFWVVLLFSVYPVFSQQSVALSYIPHWICYVIFMFSQLTMVLAIKKPKYKHFFFVISLITSGINLFTYEYFIGLEFIRPIILWFILSDYPKKIRLKKTFLIWLPYLVSTLIYIIWRVFIVTNIRGVDPILITNLLSKPLETLPLLAKFFFSDTIYVLFAQWFSTLDLSLIDFGSRSYLFQVFLIVISIISLFSFVVVRKTSNTGKKNSHAIHTEAMILGFAGVVLGCAPGWLIMDYASDQSNWVLDRLSIPAIWGAALFLAGLLFYLFENKERRAEIILIILIGLAVGKNYSTTDEFRWSSIWQNRLFNQIKWRVPYLQPNTLILADSEFIKYIPPFAMSFQYNLLYPSINESPYLDYYFLTINKYFKNNKNDIKNGIPVTQQHLYAKFEGNTLDSIVISWDKSTNCVWFLTENDQYNPLISENTRIALPANNLSRISTIKTDFIPDEKIFGIENKNTWCYYYESADLARQKGDWGNVISLYEQARNEGFSPANGVELIPFIEGFARSGKANIAMELTVVAKSLTPHMRDYTCDTWNRLANDVQNDPQFDAEYKAYSEQDLCWEVK